MNRHLHSLSLLSFIVCLVTSLSGMPVLAEQVAPLSDTAVAGYHPGFFTRTSNTESIPPLVNTYENNTGAATNTSPVVNFSFFPGDEKGQQPSLAGFVSGARNASVNISGRRTNSESYQFLVTVTPNNQGIFVWPIPEWAKNLTEFIAELGE